MYSVQQVEAGVLKYIDKDFLPAAMQAGEAVLVNFCRSKPAQLLGIATSDGQINIDALRNVCNTLVPESGLSFEVLGVSIKFTRADIDAIYNAIKES